MIELHQRHILEEVPPQRLDQEDVGRHDGIGHQRESVVGEARVVAGDEGARDDRQEHQSRRAPHDAPPPACVANALNHASHQEPERHPDEAAVDRHGESRWAASR